MRTKALLGLAALAVGLSTSVAQNVYSLNVVGYVNVSLQAGKFSFLSLPLKNSTGDYTAGTNIILDNGDGSQNFSLLYHWNVGLQQWDDANLWLGGWSDPSMVVSNGTGFFIQANASSTLTFVGEVPQGTLNYAMPPGFTTLANKVPMSTNFPGAAVGNDFDLMYTWNQAGQQWDDAILHIGGGWSSANPDGPLLNPGDGVFYFNNATAVAFSQNFTVQ